MTATDLTVALTFDDGPGPSTERLLDVLAAHGARATFFVLGRNLRGEALHGDEERAMAVAARVAGDGHVLGNHTVTHALRLTEEALRGEIAECDALVRRCYARAERPAPEPIPVRLPFGRFRFDWRAARAALERIGRSHCDWSGDFGDWRPDRTASEIANDMISHVEGMWAKGENPVILLHDAGQGSGPLGARYGVVRETTVDATALFCQRMAERSVRYTTVNRASL